MGLKGRDRTMKKPFIYRLLLSALLLSSASAAIADDAFSGMYAGVAGGASFLTGHVNKTHSFASGLATEPFTAQSKHGISKNSFLGVIYAGYGSSFCWDNTYLGTEAFIDFANRDDENFTRSTGVTAAGFGSFDYNTNVKIHPVSYGLDLRPGYKIAECILLYARLGVGLNTLTTNSQGSSRLAGAGIFTPLTATEVKKVTRAVLRLGLGIEQPLYECLTLRVDYIYSYFGKLGITANGSRTGATGGEVPVVYTSTVNDTAVANLANHAVTIGLAWHF